MELKEAFDNAVAASKTLPARPDNETLLQLYSLFKQATEGDVNTSNPPGMFDFVAKAKYDAWLKLQGTSPENAMEQYVSLVKQLSGN